jgi:hypothetical protein
VPSWTLEHPYDNPLTSLIDPPPRAAEEPRHRLVPWYEQGIEVQDFPWVDPGTSLQWRAFRETVIDLRRRQCHVLVVVGPLNEHLLAPESRAAYRRLLDHVRSWLADQQVPHVAPALLPSDLYADASHPLDEGYRQLAADIRATDVYQEWRNAN